MEVKKEDLITPRVALMIQVVDDSPELISSNELTRIANNYISCSKNNIRYLINREYIVRIKSTKHSPSGYATTEKGIRALLNFEKTVKSFLDNNTHED